MNPRWSVRVRAARNLSTVFAGKSSLNILSRVSTSGVESAPDPIQTILGALAADINGCFERSLTRRRVLVDAMEATLFADLHSPMVAAGVIGEEGNPAIEAIDISFFASTDGDDSVVESAWEEALRSSSLFQTFSKSAKVHVTFRHM
ncbi:MAG: OsmC family protein [Fimbriimonadaceae bacterium]|nr:OsmC family protein [Fimbriimonadaceae bacterium]